MPEYLLVKKSGIQGKGVYTKAPIKNGSVVFIFRGKVMKWQVKDKKSSQYGANWVGIGKDTWLDVEAPGVYTNHSCEPNCGIDGKIKVVALRDIKAGEEITIDYSITEIDKLWEMKCKCGSEKCRKVIRSIQYLPKKIYNKYDPHMPTYFKKVYQKQNDK